MEQYLKFPIEIRSQESWSILESKTNANVSRDFLPFRICWPGIPFPIVCFLFFPGIYDYRGCFYFLPLSLFMILEFCRRQLSSGSRLLRYHSVLALLRVHSRIRCWTPWKKPLLEIRSFRIPDEPSRYASFGSILHFTFFFTWTCQFSPGTNFSEFFPWPAMDRRLKHRWGPSDWHDHRWIALAFH